MSSYESLVTYMIELAVSAVLWYLNAIDIVLTLCFSKHVFVNKFGKFSHLETLETILKIITERINVILMETSYFTGRNTKVNSEYIFELALYLNWRCSDDKQTYI